MGDNKEDAMFTNLLTTVQVGRRVEADEEGPRTIVTIPRRFGGKAAGT